MEKYKYLIVAFIKRAGDNAIKRKSLRYNIIKSKTIENLAKQNNIVNIIVY